MKHLFFSLLLLSVFGGCKQPVKPTAYQLNCYVRYLEAEHQLRAEATLKSLTDNAQGTAKPFPGGLRYQGEDLRPLPAGAGNTYLMQGPGAFVQEHVFSWKDEGNEGQARQFSLAMQELKDFGFGSDTISRKRAATFHWNGPALQKGESLIFFWENLASDAKEKTHPMEIYAVGSSAIDFPAAKFAELAPGRWSLYIVRKRVDNAEIGNMKATGQTEYFTRTDTLLVE